jgi:hypothetical protein
MKWNMGTKPLVILALGSLICAGVTGCGGGGSTSESHYWHTEVLAPFGHRPMPSPDGQWIAFGGTGDSTGIWVLDRNTGDIIRLTDVAHPHQWDYQWMGNSQALVFGGAGESGTPTAGIWYVTCPEGVLTQRWQFGSDPDPAPSGEAVCFAGNSAASDEAGIWLVGIFSPQIYHLRDEGLSPKFSPSGLSIAYLLPIVNGFPELHMMSSEGTGDQLLANDIIGQEWLDNGTLICMQSGGVGVNIVKVDIGPSAQVSFLVVGGSQFALTDINNLIAYQGEENGQSLGLHVTTTSGGGNKPISPSGAHPQFLPSIALDDAIHIAFEDTDGIIMASSSGSLSPISAGLDP